MDDGGQLRVSSVLATKTCHLLVISRSAFLEFKEAIKERVRQELARWMGEGLSLFAPAKPLMKKFVQHLVSVKNSASEDMRLGAFIIREGEPATRVFLVREGRLKVTKRVSKENVALDMSTQRAFEDPRKALSDINSHFAQNSHSGVIQLELSELGPNQVFGEEDVAFGEGYSTSVQVLSQSCRLFCIEKEKFASLLNGPFGHHFRVAAARKIELTHDLILRLLREKFRMDTRLAKQSEDAVARGQRVKYMAGGDLLQQQKDHKRRLNWRTYGERPVRLEPSPPRFSPGGSNACDCASSQGNLTSRLPIASTYRSFTKTGHNEKCRGKNSPQSNSNKFTMLKTFTGVPPIANFSRVSCLQHGPSVVSTRRI